MYCTIIIIDIIILFAGLRASFPGSRRPSANVEKLKKQRTKQIVIVIHFADTLFLLYTFLFFLGGGLQNPFRNTGRISTAKNI